MNLLSELARYTLGHRNRHIILWPGSGARLEVGRLWAAQRQSRSASSTAGAVPHETGTPATASRTCQAQVWVRMHA